MYPSLILIIVNQERSIVNTFGFSTVVGGNVNGEGHANSTEHHPTAIGHLAFANPSTTKSTVDNEQSLSSGRSAFPGPGSSDSHLA
jgi:hypothetical protein